MNVRFRLSAPFACTACAGLLALLMLLASSVATGQTTQPAKPEWKPADETLAKDAFAAYEASKKHLQDREYPALVKTLADNRRPLLPKAKQADAAVAELAKKLEASGDDLDKTRQLTVDVDAAKPRPGAALTMDTTVKDFKVTLVRISLPGTRELAEKNKIAPGRWTSDEEGNLAVLMVRHEGEWYWNPFGW